MVDQKFAGKQYLNLALGGARARLMVNEIVPGVVLHRIYSPLL